MNNNPKKVSQKAPQLQNPSSKYPPEGKTCIWAILGITFAILFPILGLVFSIIALTEVNNNPELKGKGLAIAGIIISIIMIIIPFLILFGAISYFGILDPQMFIPDSCVARSGFHCNEHMIQENKVTLKITNLIGQEITTATANINGKNCYPEITNWNNGDQISLTCETTTGNIESKYSGTITLNYNTGTEFEKETNIDVVGTVSS